MPIFEYRCPKCNNKQTELIRSYKDPNPDCDVCKTPTVRLISAPNVKFKGTGFYETDFKNGGSK